MKSFNSKLIVGLMIISAITIHAGKAKNMAPAEQQITAPSEGKALIVFMRPSKFAKRNSATLFEVIDGKPVGIGNLGYNTQIAYEVDPGDYLFMILGESSDFMSATVEAGKTYYAFAYARPGALKARFSLSPKSQDEIASEKFQIWLKKATPILKTASFDKWENKKAAGIQASYEKYYAAWMKKLEEDRPHLSPDDGI